MKNLDWDSVSTLAQSHTPNAYDWDAVSSPAVNEQPKPRADQNFFERAGEDIQKRRENVAKIRDMEQGPIGQGFLEGGNAAGMVNDIVGEGFTSLARGVSAITPDAIEGPIKEAGAKAGAYVLDTFGSLPSFGGGTIGERIPQELSDLAEKHPVATEYAKAGGNLGALLYAAKPVNGTDVIDAATPVVKKSTSIIDDKAPQIGNYIASEASGAPKKFTPDIAPDSIRKAGGDLINKASKSGAVITPEAATSFVDDIVRKVAPKGNWEKAATIRNEVDEIVDNLLDLKGQPMSLEDAMGLESRLGKLAFSPKNYSMGKFSPEGKQLNDIRNALSDMIESAAENGMVTGDGAAIDSWRKGQKYWSASIRGSELARIIENAQYFDHPATAIRTGMRGIIRNKNKFSKFSKQERAAIRKAAQTGVVTDLLRLGGSGLGPIVSGTIGGAAGAMTGGPVGAAIAGPLTAAPSFAIREGSKAMATARQMGRANKAYDTVIAGSVGAPTKSLTLKEIMLLPPDQAKFYLPNAEEVMTREFKSNAEKFFSAQLSKNPELKFQLDNATTIDEAAKVFNINRETAQKIAANSKPRAIAASDDAVSLNGKNALEAESAAGLSKSVENYIKDESGALDIRATKRFAGQLKSVMAGNFPRGQMMSLGSTPGILKQFGAHPHKLLMSPAKVEKILREHKEMTPEILEQIPQSIRDPLYVVKSEYERSGKKGDALVAVLELKASDGTPVLAAVHLGSPYKRGEVNILATAYGHDRFDKWLADQTKLGNILYKK